MPLFGRDALSQNSDGNGRNNFSRFSRVPVSRFLLIQEFCSGLRVKWKQFKFLANPYGVHTTIIGKFLNRRVLLPVISSTAASSWSFRWQHFFHGAKEKLLQYQFWMIHYHRISRRRKLKSISSRRSVSNQNAVGAIQNEKVFIFQTF